MFDCLRPPRHFILTHHSKSQSDLKQNSTQEKKQLFAHFSMAFRFTWCDQYCCECQLQKPLVNGRNWKELELLGCFKISLTQSSFCSNNIRKKRGNVWGHLGLLNDVSLKRREQWKGNLLFNGWMFFSRYLKHLAINHKGCKGFVCETCGKKFASDKSMEAHQKVWTLTHAFC